MPSVLASSPDSVMAKESNFKRSNEKAWAELTGYQTSTGNPFMDETKDWYIPFGSFVSIVCYLRERLSHNHMQIYVFVVDECPIKMFY